MLSDPLLPPGACARRRLRASSAAILLCLLGACSGAVPEFVRRHTYPPGFNYVSEDKLRSSMWLLGRDTLELRRVLGDGSLDEATRRTRAELLLGGMEDSVQKIGPQQWSSNHPELESGLEALENDIHLAREAVKHEPPSYFLAGSVSGACLYCHSK